MAIRPPTVGRSAASPQPSQVSNGYRQEAVDLLLWQNDRIRRATRLQAYNGGMSSNISPAELALLEYLHERSGPSGGRIGLDPKPITRDLRINMTKLAETSASLAALGLAGVRHNRANAESVASNICAAVWVTRKGQDYLKGARSAASAAAEAAAATTRTRGE